MHAASETSENDKLPSRVSLLFPGQSTCLGLTKIIQTVGIEKAPFVLHARTGPQERGPTISLSRPSRAGYVTYDEQNENTKTPIAIRMGCRTGIAWVWVSAGASIGGFTDCL